jgi:cation:H+ antiporter
MPGIEGLGLGEAALLFVVASALVVAAGVVLARTGDEIATRTGLGGALVGTLLLAAATSLPEVVTDAAAAAAGRPDLAIGDVFGSSMANMAILAAIDLLHRGRVWVVAGLEHARLASIAIALTTIPVLAILAPPGLSIGWVGIESVAVLVAYVLAAAWFRRTRPSRDRRNVSGEIIAPTGWSGTAAGDGSLRRAIVAFGLAAGLVLLSAPLVAGSAGVIADRTGISATFLGTVLLALTTSLPELVASIAAVRIAAYALAVGNLFGSNAFNFVALFAADVAYTDGPILAAVSSAQAVAGVSAILLMALALAAVIHGDRTRIQRLEPDAILVLAVYAGALAAVYGASG